MASSLFTRLVTAAATAAVVAPALAQGVPVTYGAGTETTTRYNVHTSATYGGVDSVAYENVFIEHKGGSTLRLDSASVGIRRVGSATTPAPEVTVEVSIVQMVLNGNARALGPVVATFSQTLPAVTTSVTTPVSFSWTNLDPSLRPSVLLETNAQGMNGYGGLWVGVRFTGPNATNNLNGWRVTNEPPIGRSSNDFGVYAGNSATWTPNVWFGTTTGTDGIVRDNPARFLVNVSGAITDSSAPPTDRVYGQSFEHTSYWKPTDALDGVGSKWFYTNCFVPAQAGDFLKASKVVMGIYRAGSATTPAPAFDLELALVRMNWSGTAYTPGDVVASQIIPIAATGTAGTERVEWAFPNPATAPAVQLSTDNAANAGLGGFFVAARFRADATTLAAAQGARIAYAPSVGASWLGFGMFDANNVFVPGYVFGEYSNSTTTVRQWKPARFLVEAFGTVGPYVPPPACPTDLNQSGATDAADLATLLSNWGGTGTGDVNGSGTIDAADLAALLSAWGACP
ncbi:MAG: hypothetical protein NTU45_02515 [Planctomycetota bacterium]|nr:hypothetical protein [Planctomycetota bacterium]